MEDQQSLFNVLRMPPEMFDELLNRVGPKCQKPDTPLKESAGSSETCDFVTILGIWRQVPILAVRR
ncbi:hypothetical protein DPMN_069606 [Dreissena polymorpha]|uniref:Uncharacterized protein n=1 Tax=Dreissena polymorpha TaxID=45954 RepID=A0A9D3YZB8_DREPO|nr:hypothetical protein DPMN_069606 [Dreissena polymorpha]